MLVEQKRASFALSKISEGKNSSDPARYAALAKSLPIMVLTNGLGQTLAFLMSKRQDDIKKPKTALDDAHKELPKPEAVLYVTLQEWLFSRRLLPNERMDLLTYLINDANRDQYLTAQQEALAVLKWLKKLAEAFIREGEDKT